MRRTASLVAGVLAVVLLLTGTGVTLAAWTSDEVTVEAETFTAGNLEVELVPVGDLPEAVARAGEPYVAKYTAVVTRAGDNLRELSCDVIVEGFHWVADDYADAVNAQVVLGGEGAGAVFSYSHADGEFDDPECTLSFGESDTLEVPVEFQVESDLVCMDPAPTVGGGVAFQVSQVREGIDTTWSAQTSVGFPEVALDVAGEDELLFDVTLESYEIIDATSRPNMVSAVNALRPELTPANAATLLGMMPVVVVAGVDAATAENARAVLEGAGANAVVSVGPSAWRSIRDEPSAGLSDVIFWSGARTTDLVNAINDLIGSKNGANFVTTAPSVLLWGVDKAKAENAKAVIEPLGGVVKFRPAGGAVCW